MSRKIYLGNGKWVTSDRLVNNELETQQSGKMDNRAKKIEPNSWDQREAQSLIALLNNSHVEEPLVQSEMFPVANADQVSHGAVGNLMPEMTWDEPKPNYSGQGTPLPNQANQEVTGNPMPRMEW